jgi:hypothetical protein
MVINSSKNDFKNQQGLVSRRNAMCEQVQVRRAQNGHKMEPFGMAGSQDAKKVEGDQERRAP